MNDPATDAAIAEAANAAAVANQAQHKALVQALREAFTDDDPVNRPLLIKRIPAICNDVRDIKNTLWWMSRIGGVALPILVSLCGYFASQIIDNRTQIASNTAYIKTTLQLIESQK